MSMRIEEQEDPGCFTVYVTVADLAHQHSLKRALYYHNSEFSWQSSPAKGALVATPEDFFGEMELDFAAEYLLLHAQDEKFVFWEPEDS